MNKTFKFALGAVMSLGILSGAVAQDNFPDAPENHWAYEALGRMKREGLLVGYPDGLYRGNRPATRYEMAVALHALYVHLKGITDNLQEQIKNIPGGPSSTGVSQAAFDALKADVDNMKGWGSTIQDLQKMASTFEKELAALGVDVEALKKDVAALDARVTKLEKNALPITIHGELNAFAQVGVGTSGRFGLGTDGQIVGGTPDGAAGGRASSIWDGTSVFHDAFLKIAGVNEEGPKWDAVIQIGNMLNGYGNTPMNTAFGASRNDEANTDIVFRRFAVEFDQTTLGQNFNAKIGRMGYKISPYIFQAPDTNPYYKSPMDDGTWTMDGALLGFNFGNAKLNVFFGRTDGRSSSTGTDIGGLTAGATGRAGTFGGGVVGHGPGALAADTTFGAHLNVPIGDKGGIDLAYVLLNQNTPSSVAPGVFADNVVVFGGAVNYDMNGIKLNGGYSQSTMNLGNKSVINRDNFAWNVGAGYEADKWGLAAGYREIQPNFAAPGDWGRIGTWWNPTDIKGFHVKGHFDLSEQMTLWGMAQWMSGLNKGAYGTGAGAGFSDNSKIDAYKLGLDYKIQDGWNAMLGAEWVDFKPTGGASKATQRWYNIGFGYNLSDMAKLSLLWQISDADSKATGLWAPTRFSGNLITTQLSVKF